MKPQHTVRPSRVSKYDLNELLFLEGRPLPNGFVYCELPSHLTAPPLVEVGGDPLPFEPDPQHSSIHGSTQKPSVDGAGLVLLAILGLGILFYALAVYGFVRMVE